MKKLPYVRRREILEILKKQDCVDINQLSQQFDVSYMTIHRDIEYLKKSGEVSRIYRGVAKTDNGSGKLEEVLVMPTDLTIEERFKINMSSKNAIAKKAASYVKEGDVIGMDAGTTILHMCGYLSDMNITVVTNSISVALQFSSSTTVNVIMLGGMLRKASLTMIGPLLTEAERYLNLSKCFISSKALSFEQGLTDVTMEEPETKKSLIRRSNEVFVLADHTKIGEVSSFMVCDYTSISHIITDSPEIMTAKQTECLEKFEKKGVEVIYAHPE
jgi:DeoR/GlpR family transcriptional regulator of sugar metabolism